ncbi:MAG TPA: cupin domain-containing protein [Gaiellaceae bacterium]|jgi:mannose-6-phosphate isomerase-like protein (cupin superfamily)|nr:cupin domain-containing protein [Gaiellaceae bacterium]
MAGYTKVNLKDEVEDQAPNFGLEGKLEARMARVPLELEHQGVSYQRIEPNVRLPFGHRHKNQEEVYILVSGSLRAKLGDEVVELRPFDALRVHKDTTRGFEAGPEGAELIAVGAPNTGPGDAEVENDWWDD